MGGHGEQIPEKYSVMPASPEDAREIQEVIYQSWRATFGKEEQYGITAQDVDKMFAPFLSEEAISSLRASIADTHPGTFRFVAKRENKILGVCYVKRLADEHGSNELKLLHVLPSSKREGLGSALWSGAEKTLDPAKDTFLWTAELNGDAIRFYETLDFAHTNDRRQEPLPNNPNLSRTMIKMIKRAL